MPNGIDRVLFSLLGNFDRSEFLAWNSAAGLRDALELIRDGLMPPTGELSVMAHSMGNVVLSEALHGASGILVDTAIMSQTALSSHYFTARTDLLRSIYTEPEDVFCSSHIISHTDPAWTEYKGFPTSDAIGGLQPRLYDIGLHAGQILNYYNPDDYALASWKMDQALKPTALRGLAYLAYAYAYMDFGNVELDGGSFWDYLEFLFGKETPPGFEDTQYDFDSSTNTFYRVYMGWDSDEQEWEETSRVALNFGANAYELFAFGASSIVAPLGTTDWNSIPGVFSGGADLSLFTLPDGTTKWNTKNTGHSAQFVGSYIGVAQYWRRLLSDIGALPLESLSTGPVAASAAVPMSAPTAEQEDSQQCMGVATSRSEGLAAEPQVRAWLPEPLSYQSAAAELLATPYAGVALQGILDTEHPGVLA